ncbi:Uma2 family endonuclease [Spirosoma spitsbergense]|uniref:Uma2 family endonuclease n=1 Tax=Spirosoma spitsbergense TaxID=431554 RepID=UPI0003807D81|nr:Uma2 family endonuclease [Spirosoma spitsbergense]
MQALEKIRLTDEQVEKLEAGELVSIPASWEEFEDFLVETDYRVEYHDEQIIVTGLAKLIHEILVTRLAYLLTGYYLGKSFYVAGSNTGLRKDGKRRHYNGDLSTGQKWYKVANRLAFKDSIAQFI